MGGGEGKMERVVGRERRQEGREGVWHKNMVIENILYSTHIHVHVVGLIRV